MIGLDWIGLEWRENRRGAGQEDEIMSDEEEMTEARRRVEE